MQRDQPVNQTNRKFIRKLIYKFPFLYPIYGFLLGRESTKLLGSHNGALLLSFDIDYAEDNEAAGKILPLLQKYHISVTWASIGKWMQTYPALYKEMIREGHDIMNHSWSHPDNYQLRPGDSRKFHQLSNDEVEEEISRSHYFCQEVVGYRMRGFRLPHFRFHPQMTATLKKLDYLYTSNQFGLNSKSLGLPFIDDHHLIEIPLSAIPRKPDRIVETYRLFRNPNGLYQNEKQFFDDFRELIYCAGKYKTINVVYLDPCDVINLSKPGFEDYLSLLAESSVSTYSFLDLCKIMPPNKE
jgi:peptidoglycan-N-acetylglucosamine deacetylase